MGLSFADFCASHGLIVGEPIPGRWMRCPTEDHPRSRNGAYRYIGDVGWAQNWATMMAPAMWREDRPTGAAQARDAARLRAAAEREVQRLRQRQDKAAASASALVQSCRLEEHNYLVMKGFSGLRGLVAEDGSLVIPMRSSVTGRLVGAQQIRWIESERRYDKRMLPGTRAKAAVLSLGMAHEERPWLVEGYATGLSVRAAMDLMRVRGPVIVCFSAGNLQTIAQTRADALVFADHDASGTGERIARATGRPWCMSPDIGDDANDMHRRHGIYKVAALMRPLMRSP